MSPDLKKRQINVRNSEHIPRPANCFMIFRADWLRNSIANATQMNCVRQKQKDVSLEAAAAWNSLSPTLRQLYKIQAEIIKEEHTKKYPGWVYQPRAMKRRSTVVDGIPPDDSSTKRVARSRTVAPYQKPSVNVKGKRKTNATPFAPITAPTELVWDGSWFSGSSLMKDPFYSAPLQPLASDSSTAPPPVVPSHPQFFPPPAQMHGFGMVPNFYTMPSMYHHNGGLRNMDRHGYYASTPASNMLGLSGFRSLPQATIQAEPPVSDSPPTHSSNSAGDPTTTASSSMGEVPTPESEVKPPTQPLAESSGLICEKLFGDYYDGSGWEGNPAFNPDFDPFTMGGYP